MVVVAGFVVLGFVQGPVRRALGIVLATLILLVAMNLRAPIGTWLAGYWVRDSPAYSEMFAFGATFAILFATATLAAQIYVKPMALFPARQLANELLGGVLGLVEGVIVLAAVLLILDSYFRTANPAASPNELSILRSFFRFYDDSTTAHVCRQSLDPALFWAFGWITPEAVRQALGR